MNQIGITHHRKLDWFLCWAIVFADIGTSVYYVPGILYGEVGSAAGLFVMLTSLVFILLVFKYIEITDRFSEGGGVVTVASKAFGPWFGALGGMFITVDYFLTAAISAISGLAYLGSAFPGIMPYIAVLAIVGLILLGLLNTIGIKESATFSAIVAVAAVLVDIIVVLIVVSQLQPEAWHTIFANFSQFSHLKTWTLLSGFAGAFLAFSGIESISQLSPVMAQPRRRVAGIAMGFVVVAVLFTSPLLTIFSTNLLSTPAIHGNETILEQVAQVKSRQAVLPQIQDPVQRQRISQLIDGGTAYSSSFISELGAEYGGDLLRFAVVITAAILLLFAANTAIIGSYHVFIVLARDNFFPKIVEKYSPRFNTPHYSIVLSVAAPILIIIFTRGNIDLLGSLYAFGLLGAFSLSSLGIDAIRWREKKRLTLSFLIGCITTLVVVVAWVINLYAKPDATLFGGTLTVLGMLLAYWVYSHAPHSRRHAVVEEVVGVPRITTVAAIKPGQILVPVFGRFDKSLIDFVGGYAERLDEGVVILYLREFSDILQTIPLTVNNDKEGARFLREARAELEKFKVPVHMLYDADTEVGSLINQYRAVLKPTLTIVSPHDSSAAIDFLRGSVMERIVHYENGNILIHAGNVPI